VKKWWRRERVCDVQGRQASEVKKAEGGRRRKKRRKRRRRRGRETHNACFCYP